MTIDNIIVTPLKRISVSGGDVLHAIKRYDPGFRDFGEAYFSMIDKGSVKAWKLHRQMTLNLVVPVGIVHFVFIDENNEKQREETIGDTNYARITVPPGIWFGFQGQAASYNLLLNVADIPHTTDEVDRKPLDAFDYDWGTVK